MAKKAWLERVKKGPKFKVRGYYRCQPASASVSWRCAGRFPACAKPAGKRGHE